MKSRQEITREWARGLSTPDLIDELELAVLARETASARNGLSASVQLIMLRVELKARLASGPAGPRRARGPQAPQWSDKLARDAETTARVTGSVGATAEESRDGVVTAVGTWTRPVLGDDVDSAQYQTAAERAHRA